MLYAFKVTVDAPSAICDEADSANAFSTSCAAFWFNQLRYVCQPTAIQPENTFRNCGGTYMKLNAVTIGQNLALLTMLRGRATLSRSNVSSSDAPESREWTLKK